MAQVELQNRVHQSNSGRGLLRGWISSARLDQQAAYQPSGNGITGQASWLSLAAFGGSTDVDGWAPKSSCGSTPVSPATSTRADSVSLTALSRSGVAQSP